MINESIQTFYQLKDNPFTLTPDIHFYCQLPHYEDVLKTLLYVVEEEDGLSLVVAEVGMGKTMLCRKLITALKDNPKYHLCYVYNPHHSNAQLSMLIAQEMGADFKNPDHTAFSYQYIQDKVLQCGVEGKRVVIVIDEAQTMSHSNFEFIRLLTNLESDSRKLVKIVLFAQPEMMDKLQEENMRQLAQRISSINELKPLTAQETSYYIDSRIAAAGGRQSLFTESARKAIWQYSRGVPRLINLLASRTLLHGFADQLLEVDKNIVKNAKNDLALNMSVIEKKPKKNLWGRYIIMIPMAVVTGLGLAMGTLFLLEYFWG